MTCIIHYNIMPTSGRYFTCLLMSLAVVQMAQRRSLSMMLTLGQGSQSSEQRLLGTRQSPRANQTLPWFSHTP